MKGKNVRKNQTQSDVSFLYIGMDIYQKRNNHQKNQ